MLRQYIIKDNDTVHSIANSFFKDSKFWVDIVSLNKLDYPFITKDQDFKTNIRATGLVLLKNSSVADINIPEGTLLWISTSPEKRYRTVTDTVLLNNNAYQPIEIVSLLDGYFGNVISGMIDTIAIPEIEVLQEETIFNGRVAKVKKTGDLLLIPSNTSQSTIQNSDLELEDIFLSDSFFDDFYGDLETVKGLKNIAQRINHRLTVEKGELPLHLDYGSNIFRLIGRQEPYIEELIKLEVTTTIMDEPIVSDVKNVRIRKSGTSLYYEADVLLVGGLDFVFIDGNIVFESIKGGTVNV